MASFRRAALFAALTLAALPSLAITGCSTGSTAKGTSYKWSFNNLTSTVGRSIDDTYSAAESVLKDQELTLKESAKDAFGARIVATGVKDLRYLVELKKTGEKLTDVTVTIGTLGDEARSREIMNLIEKKLGV